MVMHTCNLSYLGGGDQEAQFEVSSGKKLARPISTSKQGMVVHACDARCTEE
jgi:hypothetical protein